jgi:hypothetical protein
MKALRAASSALDMADTDLNQPFAPQMFTDVLADSHVWQIVAEPSPAQDAATGRLPGSLRAFADRHVVGFAARVVNPRNHGLEKHGADFAGVDRVIGPEIDGEQTIEVSIGVRY